MNKSDHDIQELFQKKLGEFESAVPDSLWSSISSKLPAPSTPSASTSIFKNPFTKWFIGGAASLATVAALVFAPAENPSAVQADNRTEQKEDALRDPSESAVVQSDSNSIELKNNTPSLDQTTASALPIVLEPASTNIHSSAQGTAFEPQRILDRPTPSSADQSAVAPQVKEPISPIAAEEPINGEFGVQKIGETGLSYFFIPREHPKCSFEWDFGNGKTSTALSPNHVYDQEGMFTITLTVTSPEGQHTSTSQTICVYRPGTIKAPNAFSPGNDSSNDYFDLRSWSTNIAEYKEFVILDSNGKTVYRSLDIPLWNGRDAAGNTSPAGNYTYTVVCFDRCDQRIVKAGPIRLFRP